MKRTLKGIVAATIVLGTVVPSVFAASQTAADPNGIAGDKYQNAIELMLQKGVMINFASTKSFNPLETATRGQFIGYIYNILKNEGVITQDYTGANPFFDEDAYFSKQINDMYLFGYLDGLDFTDKNKHDAIGEGWTAPVTWVSELLCNVAGVAYDNTKAWDAYKVACAQGWFAGTGYSDGVTPNYYLPRDVMAQILENFYVSQYPDSFTGVPAAATLTAASTSTSVGQTVALTPAATDLNGNAVTLGSNDTVTYTVYNAADGSANNSATVTPNGTFVATAAGNYSVEATVDGIRTNSVSISVAGAAVGYKIVPATSTLPTDGSTDTITIEAVDANGNVASNYSGVADVTDNEGLLQAAVTNSDQASDFTSNGLGTGGTVTFTNGKATVVVGPSSSVNVTDTITVADTATTSPLTSASLNVSTATPTLTKLALATATGSPAAISANGQNYTNITITAEDAAGNTFSGQAGQYVTLNLSGPGSFVSGTTPITTETIYVPATGTSTIAVWSMPGEAGTVSISASATGLTGASLSIPTYINTAAASISIAPTATTDTTALANPATEYTVTLLDSNGHPITTNSSDLVTLSDNTSTQGGSVKYYYIDASGNWSVWNNPSTVGKPLTNGVLTFAVETTGVGTSPVTLTANDTTESFTGTSLYNFSAESAAQVALTPNSGQYVVTPGQTVTVSAQLEDSNGTAVAEAGQPIQFSFDNGLSSEDGVSFPTGQSTYTVSTNANGVASFTFTVPSNAAQETLAIKAEDTNWTSTTAQGQDSLPGSVVLPAETSSIVMDTATDTGNYASQIAVQQSGASITSVPLSVGEDLTSATPVNAIAENAIGTPVTGDELSISSSNTSVVSVNSSPVTQTLATGVDVLDDLTIAGAGTSTITVKDISNPAQPSVSFNVTVAPGNASNEVLEYNGTSLVNANTISVAANTPIEMQVVNADSLGDPIPVTGSSAVTVNLSSTAGGDFRSSPTGAPITSVTLEPGQSSVPVYYVSSGAATLTTANTTATAAPLAAPTGVTASGASGAATVAWNAETGAVSYNIYSSTDGTTYNLLKSGVTGNSYTATLTAGSYYFKVTAVNGANVESPMSSATSSTTVS